MDLTYDQQESLISILDEWVRNTRIIRYIPPQSCFVYYMEGRVHFNLELLHEDYILKFIFCNYRSYLNTFLDHIQAPLEKWLIMNNVKQFIFTIEFNSKGKMTAKNIEVITQLKTGTNTN
jgi:hypothetical protein